ncbi:MAG: hypothetical protein NTU88_05570, partial [Armatimonadetes bacterium]|nr:hypothetical protein [Armatimonadota bacterium]
MSLELNLSFPDKEHVVVRFDGEDSGSLPFVNPLTPKDRRDMQWYLEVYGAHSLGDPDDEEADRIARQLPVWGKALFKAVFSDDGARRLFNRFQDSEDDTRLLTISAEHPAVLALPWELLRLENDWAVKGGRLDVARCVPNEYAARLQPPAEPARVYVNVCAPESAGAARLNYEKESYRIIRAL